MKNLTYKWRTDADMHRLIMGCGDMIAPAVVGGCGKSESEPGRFWWRVGRVAGYADTINEARDFTEAEAKNQESKP